MQRTAVFPYRSFSTTYRPYLQTARNPRPLKMELIGCAETSVRNYSCTLRNNPEERRSPNLYIVHSQKNALLFNLEKFKFILKYT